MRYDLCNFAHLWKRGKMGCFERLILAVCWWLTAHFFVTISQRTRFVLFLCRARFASPQHPCNFNERVSLIIPLLFSLLAYSFRFFSTEEQKNIFFTLAVGLWLLAPCIVMLSASLSCSSPRTDPETSSGWRLGMLWAISLLVKGC